MRSPEPWVRRLRCSCRRWSAHRAAEPTRRDPYRGARSVARTDVSVGARSRASLGPSALSDRGARRTPRCCLRTKCLHQSGHVSRTVSRICSEVRPRGTSGTPANEAPSAGRSRRRGESPENVWLTLTESAWSSDQSLKLGWCTADVRRTVRAAYACGVAVLAIAACRGRMIAEPSPSPAASAARNPSHRQAAPSASTSAPTSDTTTPTTPTTPVATAPTVSLTAASNPVYAGDFPDPFVVTTASGYVAFSTNTGGRHVPVLTSNDLVHWTDAGDALPQIASWAMADSVWAPSVTSSATEARMYVTIGDSRRGTSCVFVATSSSLLGPYTVVDQPLVCEPGGSIDPSTVRDGTGNLWLIWKDEAGGGQPTRIRAAMLAFDGQHLASWPTTLLTSTSANVENVEGPSVTRSGAWFTVFFSAGDWRSSSYRTGYALCTNLTSSCLVVNSAWLSTESGLDAPGGLEVFTGADGSTYVAFHTGSCSHCEDRRRLLNVRRLDVSATPALA
jgi:Glycosyl hydrolases family 43